MWGSAFMFVLLIGGVTLWDGRRIGKKEKKKDLWVYLGLMGVVMVFGVVSFMGVRIPTPLDYLEKMCTPLGKMLIGE